MTIHHHKLILLPALGPAWLATGPDGASDPAFCSLFCMCLWQMHKFCIQRTVLVAIFKNSGPTNFSPSLSHPAAAADLSLCAVPNMTETLAQQETESQSIFNIHTISRLGSNLMHDADMQICPDANKRGIWTSETHKRTNAHIGCLITLQSRDVCPSHAQCQRW